MYASGAAVVELACSGLEARHGRHRLCGGVYELWWKGQSFLLSFTRGSESPRKSMYLPQSFHQNNFKNGWLE